MKGQEETLLSVVTVTYNDPDGVARTLDSLTSLVDSARSKVEVLVQDGVSGGERFYTAWPWANVICSSDSGLYDAMNRGLLRAAGRHVWFLNGGDECLVREWTQLEELLSRHEGEVIFAGYTTFYAGREIARSSRPVTYIRHALPTSHQAILYPRSVLPSRGYDVSYRMAADYALTASVLKSGVQSATCDLILARFYPGGTSSVNATEIARDARRVQREVLGSPWIRVALSQFRHLVSRNLHRLAHHAGISGLLRRAVRSRKLEIRQNSRVR